MVRACLPVGGGDESIMQNLLTIWCFDCVSKLLLPFGAQFYL
jgi:hypothetical protein